MVNTFVHEEWRIIICTYPWELRLELMLCNPAVRCSVPEKDMCKENRAPRSPLKLLVLQRANKSANTSDTFTRLYNFYHKTGSGFIRE